MNTRLQQQQQKQENVYNKLMTVQFHKSNWKRKEKIRYVIQSFKEEEKIGLVGLLRSVFSLLGQCYVF